MREVRSITAGTIIETMVPAPRALGRDSVWVGTGNQYRITDKRDRRGWIIAVRMWSDEVVQLCPSDLCEVRGVIMVNRWTAPWCADAFWSIT